MTMRRIDKRPKKVAAIKRVMLFGIAQAAGGRGRVVNPPGVLAVEGLRCPRRGEYARA